MYKKGRRQKIQKRAGNNETFTENERVKREGMVRIDRKIDRGRIQKDRQK